jgi:hypothetical protein
MISLISHLNIAISRGYICFIRAIIFFTNLAFFAKVALLTLYGANYIGNTINLMDNIVYKLPLPGGLKIIHLRLLNNNNFFYLRTKLKLIPISIEFKSKKN